MLLFKYWHWETFWTFCFLSSLFSNVLVWFNLSESLHELSRMLIRTQQTLQFSYFMDAFHNFCQSRSMKDNNERHLHPVRWGQYCSSRTLLLDFVHVEQSLTVKHSSRGGCIRAQALWILSKTVVVCWPLEHNINKLLMVPVGGGHHWEHLRRLQL